MAGNKYLGNALKAKKDEFYTQLNDINNELKHYRKHFKNKVVFCNCDDPFESNFFKYFVLNFNRLGLKKLIATCYDGSPIAGEQLSLSDIGKSERDNKAYKAIVTKVYDATGDGAIMMDDIAELFKSGENELTVLEGNGDFRSDECKELLKESDIVVTNPPFSLFREYVAQLMEYKKKFLIIGNINAVTYKEIFPLIKDEKIWWGITTNGSNRYFRVPDSYELTEKTGKIEDGVKYAFVKGVMWYTNLETKKLYEDMILVKKYDPDVYPHYDNYDAIEVSNVNLIPCDYDGIMGVPITFLNKYNPNQFEILDMAHRGAGSYKYRTKEYTEKDYPNYSDLNATAVYITDEGKVKNTYFRILIRKKLKERKNDN